MSGILNVLAGANRAGGLTPAFSYDFATEALPTGATFARASDGTYVDSSGNVATATSNAARWERDSATPSTKRGLLIEDSRTNIFTNSHDFAAAASWAKTRCSPTDNYATSPDGTTDATRLIDSNTGVNNTISITATPSVATSTAYALSLFGKPDNLNLTAHSVTAYTTPSGNPEAYYNLSTGALGTIEAGLTGAIKAYANGWYRGKTGWTSDIADTTGSILFYVVATNGTLFVNPHDGTKSILAWGAQLEAGAFASSYIQTGGSSATRAADTCICTGAGSLPDFWNDTEGTFAGSFTSPCSGTRIIEQFDDNTANNAFTVWTDGTALKVTVTVAGVPTSTITLGTCVANQEHRYAYRYAVNNVGGSLDGATEVTSVLSILIPSGITHWRIGHDATGNQLFGHRLEVTEYYDNDDQDTEVLSA